MKQPGSKRMLVLQIVHPETKEHPQTIPGNRTANGIPPLIPIYKLQYVPVQGIKCSTAIIIIIIVII